MQYSLRAIGLSLLTLCAGFSIWQGEWGGGIGVLLGFAGGWVVGRGREEVRQPTVGGEAVVLEGEKSVVPDWRMEELGRTVRKALEGPLRQIEQVSGLIRSASVEVWGYVRGMTQIVQSQRKSIEGLVELSPMRLDPLESNLGAMEEVVRGLREQLEHERSRRRVTKARIEEVALQLTLVDQQMGALNWIADQTNLLAINAQIEAARVGAAAKGFHVIAGEVHQLAQRAQTVSDEVGLAVRESIAANEVAWKGCEGEKRESEDAGRREIGRMKEDIAGLRKILVQTAERMRREGERGEALCSGVTVHMQFEDMSHQMLERMREGLVKLRRAMESDAGDTEDNELIPTPRQKESQPGAVELF